MKTMILLFPFFTISSFAATAELERGEYFHTGTMIEVHCGVTHWGTDMENCKTELFYACRRVCVEPASGKTVECQSQPLCQSDSPCGGRYLEPGEKNSFISPQGFPSTVSCSSRTYF